MLCSALLLQTGSVGILYGMQNFCVDKVKSALCNIGFILEFVLA